MIPTITHKLDRFRIPAQRVTINGLSYDLTERVWVITDIWYEGEAKWYVINGHDERERWVSETDFNEIKKELL